MNNTEIVKQSLKRRYGREKRFQLYGRCAVLVGFVFLALLLTDIVVKAWPAFAVTEIRLEIDVSRGALDLPAEGRLVRDTIAAVNFGGVIKKSLREAFPDLTKRKQKRELYRLVSSGAEFELQWLPTDACTRQSPHAGLPHRVQRRPVARSPWR